MTSQNFMPPSADISLAERTIPADSSEIPASIVTIKNDILREYSCEAKKEAFSYEPKNGYIYRGTITLGGAEAHSNFILVVWAHDESSGEFALYPE